MLKAHMEFPHSGSLAFVKGSALPVQIIQCDARGSCLVSRKDQHARFDGASRERREPLSNLAATEDEALAPSIPAKPTRRRAKATA